MAGLPAPTPRSRARRYRNCKVGGGVPSSNLCYMAYGTTFALCTMNANIKVYRVCTSHQLLFGDIDRGVPENYV